MKILFATLFLLASSTLPVQASNIEPLIGTSNDNTTMTSMSPNKEQHDCTPGQTCY